MATTGHATSATAANDAGVAITLGARPADSGANYTVGSFHTHTPTTFRDVGRPVGASAGDTSADTTDNVTGLVYDYEPAAGTTGIPKRHPINSAARLWHSGPTRRT
jgi:hypothetical protein